MVKCNVTQVDEEQLFLYNSSKTSLSHFIHIQISYLKLGSVGNGNKSMSQLTLSCPPFFL